LIRAARVRALAEGRVHVAFEDIRYFACEVLGHRMLLNYDGQAENLDMNEIVQECVKSLSETM
jgi:MoxR-like ATPase